MGVGGVPPGPAGKAPAARDARAGVLRGKAGVWQGRSRASRAAGVLHVKGGGRPVAR